MRGTSPKRRVFIPDMFHGDADNVTFTLTFNRYTHATVQQLLAATGEMYVEDAIRVILVGAAASDNAEIFMLSERARALAAQFRQGLAMSMREATELFVQQSERRLNEFVNQIHSNEEIE